MFLPFLVFFSSLFWSNSGLTMPKTYSPIEVNQAEEYRTKYINLIYGILDDESFTKDRSNLLFIFPAAPYLNLSNLWKSSPERTERLIRAIALHADDIDFTNLDIQKFVDDFGDSFERVRTQPDEKPFSFQSSISLKKLNGIFAGHLALAFATGLGVGLGSGLACTNDVYTTTYPVRHYTYYCQPTSAPAIIGYVGAILFLYASVASIVSGVLLYKRLPLLNSMIVLTKYIAFKQTQHRKSKPAAVEMHSPLAIPNWGATAQPTGLPTSY